MKPDDGDRIVLTEYERRMLADIEAGLRAGDPQLACRLKANREPRRHGPLGAIMIVSGLAVVATTVTLSLWIALIGMTVTGAGITLVALDVAARLMVVSEGWTVSGKCRRDARAPRADRRRRLQLPRTD